LSKEDFCCKNVHVFEALIETMALKKLTSFVILNVTGSFSALGQQGCYCRNAVFSMCDCSF